MNATELNTRMGEILKDVAALNEYAKSIDLGVQFTLQMHTEMKEDK